MINISGRFDNISGYSTAIRNLSLGLDSVNAPLRVDVRPICDSGIYFDDMSFGCGNYVPLISVNYNCVPGSISSSIDKSDKILAMNKYTHKLLVNSGFNNVEMFHIPINKPSKGLLIKEKRGFNFLSVLNTNKCYEWRNIIRSFYSVFSDGDDVSMVLKIYAGDDFSIYSQRNIINEIQKIKSEFINTAPIIFIGSKMSDRDMMSLYSSVDCFVKLEGVDTGYSFMNACASNLVCIGPSSGVGGDIISEYGGIKVDKKSAVKNVSNRFLRGSIYDTFSEDSLKSSMRYVFSNHGKVKEKNIKNRKRIFNEYGINSSVYKFLNTYKNIFE
jgi:hypothetical protein